MRGNYTLFDPLSGNWNCAELTDGMVEILKDHFDGKNGVADWDDLANAAGKHSCDQVQILTMTNYSTSKKKNMEPIQQRQIQMVTCWMISPKYQIQRL